MQGALLGSILVNLLLILGTAILVGSLNRQEQLHNAASAQALACLLCSSLFGLLIPVSLLARTNLRHIPELISLRRLCINPFVM